MEKAKAAAKGNGEIRTIRTIRNARKAVENLTRPPVASRDLYGSIVITVNAPLRSPNASLWKHWRVRQREKLWWKAAILSAIVPLEGALAALPARSGIPGARGLEPGRRRVTIERWIPYAHHAIRDVDNLVFSTKFLLDAIVALGLVRDDSPAWCERPIPNQIVSLDHRAYTVITITALDS